MLLRAVHQRLWICDVPISLCGIVDLLYYNPNFAIQYYNKEITYLKLSFDERSLLLGHFRDNPPSDAYHKCLFGDMDNDVGYWYPVNEKFYHRRKAYLDSWIYGLSFTDEVGEEQYQVTFEKLKSIPINYEEIKF